MACRWPFPWLPRVGHPLAFEPEGGPADEALAWDVLTWGQYKFQFVPTVDRYRWLEPRHQVNIQGAGIAIRPTTFNLHFSTEKDGRAGKTSGASGTV